MHQEFGPIIRAVRTLANVCDGAHAQDGAGFNKGDSSFGTRVAMIADDKWTAALAYQSWLMLAKYAKQLTKYGIDYDSIPAPPRSREHPEADLQRLADERRALGKNVVTSNGFVYVIEAEYDPQLISLISAIPGATWNSLATCWVVPRSSQVELTQLVSRYNFATSQDVINLKQEPNGDMNIKGSIFLGKSNKLIYDFAYNQTIVNAIRLIPGRMWDTKKKVWTSPLTIQAVEIADKFDLYMEKELREHLAREAEAAKELLEQSTSVDADIEIPTLSGTLMPYQRAGVAYASRVGRCLIADQMGLGKTVEAIATLESRDAFPAVIVCPASLKENWRRELTKWLPHRTVNVLSSKDEVLNVDVNIINYDILAKFIDPLTHLKPQGLVFDESHYVKTGASKRTKAARALAAEVPQTGSVLLLSGTPVTNRPEELVSQLEIMGMLGKFGGKWNFLKRYTGAFHNGFGWDTSGASNLSELNTKLRQNCYIRRVKDEVLKELPEKTRNVVTIEPSGTGYKEYRQAEDDLYLFLKSNGYRSADSAEHLSRTVVLKRLAAHAKMEGVIEWIDSFLASCDRKLVVFAHNVDVVDYLAERYGGLRVSGRDDMEERQHAVDSFQNDPASRVIVLNLQAGGVGITLTAASDVVFVQMGWTPAEHDQAEDRCHRIGQTNNVQAWYLIGSGTIDEHIYDIVDDKRTVVDAVTEGDDAMQQSVIGDLMKRLMAQKDD
jgi:SNF2 family DNA or RNA helicase